MTYVPSQEARYEMYSPEGNMAVHRMVTCIVRDLLMPEGPQIRVAELPGRIRQGCEWADKTGHSEVWDTVPQGLIEDEINRTLLHIGWPRISREDW